jgi:KDO2-lipid IV(A) lauroyltransferase
MRIANRIARSAAARKDSELVQAVRANQWMASGRTMDGPELDAAAEEVLLNAARAQYELYRYYRDTDGLLSIVDVHPTMEKMLDRAADPSEGTIVVGPHVGNFDLGLHALGHVGFRAQVLSVPDPGGGYRWQNEQREHAGLELTPMSKSALVTAAERLKSGGAVGTGVDRPVESHKYMPRLFGRPAPLPVAHVRLALMTGAPIYLVAAHLRPNERYDLHASGPIYLEPTGDRMTDTVSGAERVLAHAEDMILEAPRQWLMFYPVWPDVMDDVP